MKTLTLGSLRQRSIQLALSAPAQAVLYTTLWALVIWMVYFSTYPPAHNAVHTLRHHTLGVSCH
jgi:hypothetical protein